MISISTNSSPILSSCFQVKVKVKEKAKKRGKEQRHPSRPTHTRMSHMVDARGYATYGAYQQPSAYPTNFAPQQQFYANPYAAAPAAFPGAYPTAFQQPRGRGMMMGGRGGFGGFRGGFQQQGYVPQQGFGGYGGGMGGRGGGAFGMRARRKKPFVGGSLETQRQWEQQTVCCFFLQGQCRFSDGCRFVHENDASRGCQFGTQCRVGHGGVDPAQAPVQAQQLQEAPQQ